MSIQNTMFRMFSIAYSERRDEGVVGIEICNDLKSSFQRNDLTFDVSMEYTTRANCQQDAMVEEKSRSREKSYPHLLVKHLQNFLACTALEKPTMHLQARYRLTAAKSRAEFESILILRVILAGFSSGDDDVLDLVHEHIRACIHTRGDRVV